MTGMKFDDGKNQLRLVIHGFASALWHVGLVATHGAEKYAPDNWKIVENGVDRYTDALYRHQILEASEGMLDRDSGLLHAAHAAWNALARLELMLAESPPTGMGERPKPTKENILEAIPEVAPKTTQEKVPHYSAHHRPDWVSWIAKDKNGAIYGYAKEPVLESVSGMWRTFGTTQILLPTAVIDADWHKSKIDLSRSDETQSA